jgi:hypothetical protein
MTELLHPIYLPFTKEQLRQHFAAVGTDSTSAGRHLEYYLKSAEAAKAWERDPATGTSGEVARAKRHSLQIQKDERFWVATALMSLFHSPDRVGALADMLRRCLGDVPPLEGWLSWEQALGDGEELSLFFEVSLPTSPSYREHLAGCLSERVLIPHVLESANNAEATGHALEGATKADAVLIAPKTGFAVLFEAKVLADASGGIGFDVLRNQIARSIDVMLEPNPNLQESLTRRRPNRTFFVLITPEIFRDHPESRLYGWLMRDYRNNPVALQRDLPHRRRAGTDLASAPSRLGWLTWEDFNKVLPGACRWLSPAGTADS